MSIRLEVWGEYALFTRPEMKTERVSYDVMTPSAARGILEAVYWHPGMRYHIDRITVLNPIKFTNIRRNEVKSVITRSNAKKLMEGGDAKEAVVYTAEDIQQRASMLLKDVRYVIDAHFTLTNKASTNDSAAKFISIFNRRAERGQCYHHPYFGTREFLVDFRPWETWKGEPQGFEQGHHDLGYMLYDMDYSDPTDIRPLFFRAELKDGVLDLAKVRTVS